MTSKVDLSAPSAHSSVINLRATNKVGPNGTVVKQQMQLLGKRPRRRKLSAGSSVNLEIEVCDTTLLLNIAYQTSCLFIIQNCFFIMTENSMD